MQQGLTERAQEELYTVKARLAGMFLLNCIHVEILQRFYGDFLNAIWPFIYQTYFQMLQPG